MPFGSAVLYETLTGQALTRRDVDAPMKARALPERLFEMMPIKPVEAHAEAASV